MLAASSKKKKKKKESRVWHNKQPLPAQPLPQQGGLLLNETKPFLCGGGSSTQEEQRTHT